MSAYLAIRRCPVHPTFWSISVEGENGSGVRIAGSKCCGRWDLVERFKMTADSMQRASDEIQAFAILLEEDGARP